MKLILLSLPPSVNQLERMHWAVRRKMRTRFCRELAWAMIEAQVKPPIREPDRMRVQIKVYRPRRFDPDNAMGGLKPLIDAMRDLGLLKNDSPKWIDLSLEQYVDGKNPRTEIEMTALRSKVPRA